MADPRNQALADVLIHHSTALKAGEHVLIEAFDIPDDLVKALVRTAQAAGANPYVWIKQNAVTREILLKGNEGQLDLIGEMELAWMRKMDAYIGIRGGLNVKELSDVPQDKMRLYQEKILKPVHFKERVNNTRWVILRYPQPSFAQMAGMSTDAFETFFYNVCTLDYKKMEKAMQPLVALMDKTDRVRLTGPDTDLRFSIKDIPVIGCSGEHNIPDGEVFTAPVRDSIDGTIHYNTPTIYQGTAFSDIRLTFKAGKVVAATADKTEKLNEILDTDEGARYVGEFAIGFNPYVVEPMLDILFDEKMAGSFHFTPGQAYETAFNGNNSNIHWDMVMRQSTEQGGGNIYFDDVLIRENGIFVHPDLLALNPENLIRG